MGRIVFGLMALGMLTGCNSEVAEPDAEAMDDSAPIETAYHRPVFSPDGKLLIFMRQSAKTNGDWELYSANADGANIHRLTHHQGWDGYASFSPDGSIIVFDRGDAEDNKQPVMLDLSTGEETVIPVSEGWLSVNGWLPDATGFFGFWEINGQRDLYVVGRDGEVLKQITDTPDISEHDAAITADGTVLYFASERSGGSGSALEKIDLSTGARSVVVSSPGRIYGTALSPDETILSYTDDTPGDDDSDAEIYFLYLQSGVTRQLTDNTVWDHQAVWRPNSDDVLFTSYRSGAEKIYRLDIETGNAVLFFPE